MNIRRRAIRIAVLAWPAAAFLAAALSCGGIRTPSRDGYRATLVFTPGESYRLAVRGESRRVYGATDCAPIVKIVRPDLKKTWQFRPTSQRILEETWSATDEIVPGFPLDPRFDQQAYASRFSATVTKVSDGAFGGHPCDRYRLDLPSGDRAIVWAARDLERLPIRIEHEKKKTDDEFQPFLDVQLTEIRVGAEESLFEKPKGYTPVKSYEELRTAK
jgi:hypothetical protein